MVGDRSDRSFSRMPDGTIRYRKRIKRIEPTDPSVLDNKYRHALQRVATNFLAEVSGTTLNHGVRIWASLVEHSHNLSRGSCGVVENSTRICRVRIVTTNYPTHNSLMRILSARSGGSSARNTQAAWVSCNATSHILLVMSERRFKFSRRHFRELAYSNENLLGFSNRCSKCEHPHGTEKMKRKANAVRKYFHHFPGETIHTKFRSTKT